MALKAIIGKPGSGKSYITVVDFILSPIADGAFVIGNIKLNDNVDISNYYYLNQIELDNLHASISSIMKLDISHDTKKIKLKDLFLSFVPSAYVDYTTSFVFLVDECHLNGYRNGSSRGDNWADDFVSIHRHIFSNIPFDIVLITQVSSRIAKVISLQCEMAYKAIPATSRFSNNLLEYRIYDGLESLDKNDKFGLLKRKLIKGDPNIFDLYQSGFNMVGDNSFKRKIIALLLLIGAVSAYVIYAFMHLVPSSNLDASVPLSGSVNRSYDDNNSDNNSTPWAVYDITCTFLPKHISVDKKDYFYKIVHVTDIEYCVKVYAK